MVSHDNEATTAARVDAGAGVSETELEAAYRAVHFATKINVRRALEAAARIRITPVATPAMDGGDPYPYTDIRVVDAKIMGPRPAFYTCRGCPSFVEVKRVRLDSNKFVVGSRLEQSCSSASRMISVDGYDQFVTPDWCPVRTYYTARKERGV